jgi:hypothetical protein
MALIDKRPMHPYNGLQIYGLEGLCKMALHFVAKGKNHHVRWI